MYYPRTRKRKCYPSKRVFNPNEDILMPSDVTDDMLENVIDDFVSNKVYDQGPKGSTCHQKAKKTQVHGYHGKKKVQNWTI